MTDTGTSAQASTDQAIRHLERLAAELPAGEYDSRLVIAAGKRPRLHVRNHTATVLAEDIVVHDGWFWYSFAERIAPVSEPIEAAGKIARVLRAVGSG